MAPAASPQPLSTDPSAFWSGQPVDSLLGDDGRNAEAMPVVAALGPLPLWHGEEDFLGAVTQAIKQAVPRGLQAWVDMGETSSSP